MSLDVSPDVLAAAERGERDDAQFLAVVRDSLPYAWHVVGAAVDDRAEHRPAGGGAVARPATFTRFSAAQPPAGCVVGRPEYARYERRPPPCRTNAWIHR